jgi:uncharacterized protein YndB with AHSA1/START domain
MRVEKELVVNAPVSTVYALWTDFENFPRFMSHVESVTKVSDDTYHWKAKVGLRNREWDARVVGLVPNRSVTWRSVEGEENAGAVNLAEQGNVTMMQVVIEYHPNWFEGVLDTVTHEMSRSVEADLEKFKRLAEGTEGEAAQAQTGAQAQAGGPGGQGATSESMGAGNAGTVSPSSMRAGQSGSGVTSGVSAAGAASMASAAAAGMTGATGPHDAAPMSRSGAMQGGSEGGGEYATGGASSGSLGGSLRSGSMGQETPVPGEETIIGSMGPGGANASLPSQAGDIGADSRDLSVHSGEAQHGFGVPPVDETVGAGPPMPVSGSHHNYAGTDIVPEPGATGFSDTNAGSAGGDTGSGATADNATGVAMDSGAAAGLDSTSGGGSQQGAVRNTPAGANQPDNATGGSGLTGAGAPTGTASIAGTDTAGVTGPSLYSNEAAGYEGYGITPGETPGGASSGNAGTSYPTTGTSGTDSGAGSVDRGSSAAAQTGGTTGSTPGDTTGGSGATGSAVGAGTPAQTTGAISGGMQDESVRPIDEERGTTPGMAGGTGGWGSPTGGASGSGAMGNLEQGKGVGGAATGDPGQEVGLPAVSTTDMNLGQQPTGESMSMGPSTSSGGSGSLGS